MFGIRTWLSRHFGGLKDAFSWIRSQKNQEKVAKEIGAAINLAAVAAPFVKNIAQLFAGEAGVAVVDEVQAAASRIGVQIEGLLEETDPHKKAGLALDLAGESVREKLRAIIPTLDHGLEIDGKLVTTIEQLDALPSSALQTAAQIAVRALKITGEIGKLAKDTIEGQ